MDEKMKYEVMSDEELEQTGVQEQKSQIVNAALFIDALKSSGYKSTYNAIAEIVDNSIDAEASNIFIIGEQNLDANRNKSIVSFAFLDDGKGMDVETLKQCLTIGYTTNHSRKGMGRFGVGLPQASIFVCNRVEVYSWQNGIENCKMVYLDVDEIKQHNLNEIGEPVEKQIPSIYKKYLTWTEPNKQYNFKAHGTLVVWNRCTNIDHKKWATCVSHMERDLGRKYRYFLCDGSKTIKMMELADGKVNDVLPNDPLYLMAPSQECVPEDVEQFIKDGYVSNPYDVETNYTEPMFELYKPNPDTPDSIDVVIKYEHNGETKEGIAHIKFSIVKKKYYSPTFLKTSTKPGSLPFGSTQTLKDNIGISIVRNKREIDFGSFGFFDIYNVPEFRWWGIEISFNSDLDMAFGISNNKQSVNIKPMSKEEIKDVGDDDVKPVWLQLYDEIHPTIESMKSRNAAVRGEPLDEDNPEPQPSSLIVNAVETTLSDEDNNEGDDALSQEEKESEARQALIEEGNENPTPNEIKQFIDSKVRISLVSKGKHDNFVDISYAAGTLTIHLNRNHPFYEEFVQDISEDDSENTMFELLLIALFNAVKGLNARYQDAMDDLIYDFNIKLTKYINEWKKRNG